MSKKKDVIRCGSLFNGLPDKQIEELADIASVKSVGRGEAIFFEGEDGIGFYMVLEGQVKIFKMSFDGKEQILHVFGPGEPFGEVAVFQGLPFPANAQALNKSKLLFFPRKEFINLLSANPSLALNMLGVLSLRLRRFAAQVESLSLREVPGRLAAHLRYLAEEQGRRDLVILDIPKGQLASLLGTIPETLSRIFAKMSDEGLIRVEGKEIHILDFNKLLER